jgi:hypothetical protein
VTSFILTDIVVIGTLAILAGFAATLAILTAARALRARRWRGE